MSLLTCSEVNQKIQKEYCVRDAVKYDPRRTIVIIEERNPDRKYYQVGHKQHQHTKIPVQSTIITHRIIFLCMF